MRCHAYQLPAEIYRDLEPQLLEQLRVGDYEQLRHLVGDHELEVVLLSGEWRVMMAELGEYYQVVDLDRRMARMAVGPDELAGFVAALGDEARQDRWRPISFGLAELRGALPRDSSDAGLVFVEESDDWLWAPPVHELVAMRPDVFELIEPHMRALLKLGDFRALARLAEDHSEGCVEFSAEQWDVLIRHSKERVPELMPLYEAKLAKPNDYTSIREALSLVADPNYQPSLDAWLRVHAPLAQYALYFRDAHLERREFEVSGEVRYSPRATQRFRVPIPGLHTAFGPSDASPSDDGPQGHEDDDSDGPSR